MKRFVLAFLLLPAVALAQVDPVTSGAQAMALDGGQMFARMAGQIAADQREIDGLKAQHAADAKALAAAKKPAAGAKVASAQPCPPDKPVRVETTDSKGRETDACISAHPTGPVVVGAGARLVH